MKFFYYKCRPNNYKFPWIAWLIMLCQGMLPWKKESTSHRALGYYCSEDTKHVIDSTGKSGVRKICHDEFRKEYNIVSQVEFKADIDKQEFYKWTALIHGRKYDYKQIAGLLAKKIFGFITFNSFGKDFRSLICNEVILHFITYFKIIKTKLKDSDNWDILMTDQLIDKIKNKL